MSSEPRRSKTLGIVLCAAVRFLVGVLEGTHWRMSRFLGKCVAEVWWLSGLDGRKKNAISNIRKVFPQMSISQARRMLRESANSFCVSLADGFQFRKKMLRGEWRESVNFQGEDLLDEIEEGQGIIFVTAHLGVWEATGVALPQLGYPIMSVARGLPYPELDEYVRELRETGGQTIVDKNGALRPLLAALRDGRNVALLIDQDGRRDGVFVDFLGRPSSVHTSIARMSISTGCPVAFVCARAEGEPPTFNIRITDVVWPNDNADKKPEIYRITQALMNDAEEIIRQYPGEWLWTQKQWKTYPGKFTEGRTPMPGVLETT